MFTQPYYAVLDFVVENAPLLESYTGPAKVIKYAEDTATLLAFIYNKDTENIQVDIIEGIKADQGVQDD